MITGKKKYGFYGMIVVMILSFSSLNVFAQDVPDAGMQISPLRYDWKMIDGEVRSDEITVHNYSEVPQDIEVSVEDFYVSEDSRQANFYVPDDAHPLKAYDVMEWIDAPENFTLVPGETKKMKFTIAIPEGQSTSGYYGSIFFKTRADGNVETTDAVQLDVNYRIGLLVTLAVQGDEDIRIDGKVQSFTVDRIVFFSNPATLTSRIKSTGNTHYKVKGYMQIEKFGKKYAKMMISPEILYPDRERAIEKKVQFKWWDYGIYQARMQFRSEDKSVELSAKTNYFIVIPWQPTVFVVSILAFVIIFVRMFRKKYKIVKRKE